VDDSGAVKGAAGDLSASPVGLPRTGVPLIRWIVLIAVVAVCLIWVPPVVWPVILLPVAVAAFVPRGGTWLAIETWAAIGWLVSAVAVFSEIRPEFVEELCLAGSDILIGQSWIIGRVPFARNPRARPTLRWLLVPTIGLIGVILLMTDRDFAVRFALSEPALRASALREMATPGAESRFSGRVGLFWPTALDVRAGSVIFWTKGGFLEQVGLAYVPGGVNPQTIPGIDGFQYENLGGSWWTVLNN